MSEPTGARRYGTGGGDAYYDAVRYGGYKGTREQFGKDQAEFATNATAVAAAKEVVEQDTEEVRYTKETFVNTTVPDAITAIQQEGTTQVQAVTQQGEKSSQQVETVGTQWKDEVANEGRARVQAVEQAGTNQVQAVNDAGTAQVGAVNQAGADQVTAVEQAGTDQVQAVTDEGTTQVTAVEDAGAAERTAIEEKGKQTRESIPDDYTALSDEVDNLNRQISDETTGLNSKAPVILETVSGAIASFDDGADSMPIRKLVAQIEPVQDLHGYANPWPAGGGKNLHKPYVYSNTSAGVTFTYADDGSVTVNGTATATSGIPSIALAVSNGYTDTLPAGTYTISAFGQIDNIGFEVYRTSDSTRLAVIGSPTFTLSEEATVLFRAAVTNGTTYNNQKVYFQLESGSTSSAQFSPYSNICPISGWTGAEIEQTGANVWDEGWEVGYFWQTSKGGISYGTSNTTVRSKNYIPVKPATAYYGYNNASADNYKYLYRIAFFDKEKQYISMTSGASGHVFTTPDNCYYVKFYCEGIATYSSGISINYPATDTQYHPYTGDQISVNWETEAGTVYGGENEVISGKLKSTMGIVDLGTLNWEYNTNENINVFTSGGLISVIKSGVNLFCSNYKISKNLSWSYLTNNDKFIGCNKNIVQTSGYIANGAIVIKDTNYTNPAIFKAAMSGVQLCYELAEPVEYTLTPQEMKTLYGANNIWANAGPVSVDYPADTKLYIDGKLAELQATILENIGG